MSALIFITATGGKICTSLGDDKKLARERFEKTCKNEIELCEASTYFEDLKYWYENDNELHIKWTDGYDWHENILFFDEDNNSVYK